MDLRHIAHVLGGTVVSGWVRAPAPGHSSIDDSLAVRIAPDAPGGLWVHLFSPGDALAAKDHVLDRLGLPRRGSRPARPMPRSAPRSAPAKPNPGKRTASAIRFWEEARDPARSTVEAYLRRRGLTLPEGAAGAAIRYHPSCPFSGNARTPAMIALVRDVVTDAPKAVHRTALDLLGRKVTVGGNDRLSLGPVGGGAIKLTADDEITTCLGIGEGIESALSLRLLPEFGSSPVWSLISAGGIEQFPVLPGIEALWIAVDHDPAGHRAAKACGDRWSAAGVDVYHVTPRTPRTDLNDVFKGRADA